MDLAHRRPLEPHRGRILKTAGLTDDARALFERLAGAVPNQPDLWLQALTHGSMAEPRDYQRLEFLGDRVLGLTIAEWLHESGGESEGRLSQRLNVLVSRETCAAIARKIALGPHIRLGKQASDDGGRDSDNILGDVIEALIGACFVDHGFDSARAMIRNLWADTVSSSAGQAKHPKSALQEWAAGNRRKAPAYRLVKRSGPDHAASFTVAVEVPGVGTVEATGTSKQEAETAAAAAFMEQHG